jgi:7-cyano-7-deazaguanine synthase in queuosine biosynthesis
MDKEILLYSGGPDCLIAYHYLGKPQTLYVNLGHKYRDKEKLSIFQTIPNTIIMDNEIIGNYEKKDAEIPMRNLLLSMCGVWEGAEKVWISIQKDEMNIPDRSEEFFLYISSFLSFLSGKNISVDTPFRNMDKTDMVTWYIKNVGDMGRLLSTTSCYSDPEKSIAHCGDCPACFRRYVAFKNNDVDPGYKLTDSIKAFYRMRYSEYSETRQSRMKKVLGL